MNERKKLLFLILNFLVLSIFSTQIFTFQSPKLDEGKVLGAGVDYSVRLTDGIILKNGDAFFPFGFYHVSDVENRYGSVMASDVEKLGKAGFNTVELTVTGPDGLSSSESARQKAAQYGMSIIATYYAPRVNEWIQALKLDPTIMAWSCADDFNSPYSAPRTTPAQIQTKCSAIKEYAKSVGLRTWVYGSGGGYPYSRTAGSPTYRTTTQVPYLFGEYALGLNVAGVQSYPISNTDNSFANTPLEENMQYLKYSRDQMPKTVPVIANIQTFKWTGGRFPTADEIRNMVYAAIIQKLSGIVAYAYHEESGTIPEDAPQVWNEMVAVRRDINGEFLNAILNGKYTKIDTNPSSFGKGKVHAATFMDKNRMTGKIKVYAIILNTSSTQTLTVSGKIPLPTVVRSLKSRSLFAGDSRYVNTLSTNLVGEQVYLDGSIKPMGVAVYVFE